jgi:hypothetical protein
VNHEAHRYDHRTHFASLPQQEQLSAVQRLAATGETDYGIAHATGLAVEQVRRFLSERRPA